MRIAVLPITSFRHLKGESEVVMFTAMIKQWVQDHEDCFFYMILPEDCQDQGWEGEFEEWPRCQVLWTDKLGLYYDKLTEVPANFLDTFNPRHGRYQIDGILTSRRAAAASLARELWDHRMKSPLPVFIDESMTVEWGRTSATVSDIEIVAQTLGYAMGYPIWDTEVQRENALDAARHWLAGKRVLEVMEKGVVIPCGFSPDRIDRIVGDGLGKEDRFTCFFGGRLNRGAKRADVLVREFDTLFKFGRDIDITVSSPKDEGWMLDHIRKAYPEIQVLVQTPSDEFVARAARAHIFFNTSAHEGFSVGFTEMMYMTKYRTVLIAPRLPWVRGLFKEEFDKYPFLYEDFDQARVMLRWMHENYEEAADQVQYLGDFVKQYDSRITYETQYQHMANVIDTVTGESYVRQLMSPGNQELLQEAFDALPKTFTMDQLYQEMIARSRAMKEDPRRGQTTKYAVRRWLMIKGMARDLYDHAHPRMEKL